MKSILVSIGIIFIGIPTYAKEKCDRSALNVSTAWFRAAQVCQHPNWISRKANSIIDEQILGCESQLGEPEYSNLILQGMKNFDEFVKTQGKEAACKKADEQMIRVENLSLEKMNLQTRR